MEIISTKSCIDCYARLPLNKLFGIYTRGEFHENAICEKCICEQSLRKIGKHYDYNN